MSARPAVRPPCAGCGGPIGNRPKAKYCSAFCSESAAKAKRRADRAADRLAWLAEARQRAWVKYGRRTEAA